MKHPLEKQKRAKLEPMNNVAKHTNLSACLRQKQL